MRILAIDLGTRRVGLAMGETEVKIATPLEVLEVTSPEQAMSLVQARAREEQIERLVLGIPINMDDSIGPAARHTAAWGKQLAERLGVNVIFIDERLSSFSAEQQLIDRKRAGEHLTRRKKKGQLDALAAAGFLQAYLDGSISPIDI